MFGLSKENIREGNKLLRQKLAQLGITDVRLAAELEFTSFADTQSTAHSESVKQSIIADLETQISHTSSTQARAKLESRKTAVATFSAREVMMFDILGDQRIAEMLEPLFGTSRDGQGYYDGEGVLELKIKPCDESLFNDHLNLITSVLREKAEAYGFDPDKIEQAGIQLNYSLHDVEGNIFAAHTHAPDKLQRITTGVSYALRDAHRHLDGDSKFSLFYSTGGFYVSPGREDRIRIAPNRMELRLNRALGEIDADNFSMILMAGAAYGLSPHDDVFFKEHVAQTSIVNVLKIKSNDLSKKILTHTLEGCIVGSDGYLIPPEQYIWQDFVAKDGQIGKELGYRSLGCTDTNCEPTAEVIENLKPIMHCDSAIDIFRRTRLIKTTDGGYKLEWPRDRLAIKVVDPNDFYAVKGPRIPFDPSLLESTFSVTGLRIAAVSGTKKTSSERNPLISNRALRENLSPHIYAFINPTNEAEPTPPPDVRSSWKTVSALTKPFASIGRSIVSTLQKIRAALTHEHR